MKESHNENILKYGSSSGTKSVEAMANGLGKVHIKNDQPANVVVTTIPRNSKLIITQILNMPIRVKNNENLLRPGH